MKKIKSKQAGMGVETNKQEKWRVTNYSINSKGIEVLFRNSLIFAFLTSIFKTQEARYY